MGRWFEPWFKHIISCFNQKWAYKREIKVILKKYNKRILVFHVINDSTYIFRIFNDKIEFEVDPIMVPDDMYLEMDMERAERLIYDHHLDKSDILFGKIKRKNIKFEDFELLKGIFRDFDEEC
jgi:hypothetical protein